MCGECWTGIITCSLAGCPTNIITLRLTLCQRGLNEAWSLSLSQPSPPPPEIAGRAIPSVGIVPIFCWNSGMPLAEISSAHCYPATSIHFVPLGLVYEGVCRTSEIFCYSSKMTYYVRCVLLVAGCVAVAHKVSFTRR